jgi:thioredoxin 2
MPPVNAVCPQCQSIVRIPGDRLQDRPKCPRCKADVLDGRPLHVDGRNFARHTEHGDLPLLVDFWAPWCGPCRMMAPVLDQAAARWSTRLKVGKLNTDEEQDLAARFGIRSIPTLILFAKGREVGRKSGAMDLGSLERWLTAQLPLHRSAG